MMLSLIKPLQLGQHNFSNNIIQGPLAGISCAPFRRLTTRYGQPAFCCTEMISSKTLLNKPSLAQRRFLWKDPTEGPLCFQLAADDPEELAEATKIVTQHGADLVDLNCGCPVKKMRAKGMGSKLLATPQKIYQLIVAMKQNTHVPVSVKIRVDGQSDESFNAEIAKVVTEAGADYLIVHGRHWREHYETPCRYEQIRYFVEHLKIPVIGNGDVACVDSLKRLLATGCAGAMIARAGVGQPWLIQQLIAEYHHQPYTRPTPAAIAAMLLEHVQGLIELLASEKFAILQARKFAKYYARYLPERAAFHQALNHCQSYSELATLCYQYF